MEIKVKRNVFTENSTIGQMTVDGIDFCSTIEDKDRGLMQKMPLPVISKTKVFGKTCIPYGTYEVAMTYSNRFKTYMPQILDVPGFAGIRIHVANSATDVEGCIGVGLTQENDFIGMSKAAYTKLLAAIKKVERIEKIKIAIVK